MVVTLSEMQQTAKGTNKKVLMLYAGGITGHSEPNDDNGLFVPMKFSYVLNQLSDDMIAYRSRGIDIVPENYTSTASTNFRTENWKEIASKVYSRSDIDGAVIIHGPDVMDYTASALSFMLENLRKPVVLIGGFKSLPGLKPEAREDIAAAVSIAAGLDISREKSVPRIPEVCVYTRRRAGNSKDLDHDTVKLLRGNRAIQYDTESGFESLNYPPLCEDDLFFKPENILPMPDDSQPSNLYTNLDDRIALLSWENNVNDERLLRRFIENQLICNPKAIVVNSILSNDSKRVPKILKILDEVKKSDVPVVLASNMRNGVVVSGDLKVGLYKMGMVSAGDMTVPAAVTKTSYLLGKGRMDLITRNLCGEISGPLVRNFD